MGEWLVEHIESDETSIVRRDLKVLVLADGDNDPTCADHALVNILEERRKAIDAVQPSPTPQPALPRLPY